MKADLEHFPTSPAAVRMMSYITRNWYDKSYVGKWIFQVMGDEIDGTKNIVDSLKYQIFAETATWGIVYHEMRYGIQTDPDKSLDERRREVINRRDHTNRMPWTPYFIKNLVLTMFGLKSNVVDHPRAFAFTLEILFGANDAVSNPQKIYDYIRRVKPSHLTMDLICSIEAAVLYERERFLLQEIGNGLGIQEPSAPEMPVVEVIVEVYSGAGETYSGNVMIYENLNQWNGQHKFNGEIKFNTEVTQEVL